MASMADGEQPTVTASTLKSENVEKVRQLIRLALAEKQNEIAVYAVDGVFRARVAGAFKRGEFLIHQDWRGEVPGVGAGFFSSEIHLHSEYEDGHHNDGGQDNEVRLVNADLLALLQDLRLFAENVRISASVELMIRRMKGT